MKFLLRMLGITLGLAFLVFTVFSVWPEASESGVFGLIDVLIYGVVSGCSIFYGLTGESNVYQYFSKHRRKPDDADT
jgi:hypothetical protein